MKKKWFILLGILVVIAVPIAWYLLSPLFIVVEMDEAAPEDTVMLSEALFQARTHDVSGKVFIIDSSGTKILRFEDFETLNGPDLRVYLATDTNAEDYIDLGELKATKGNVNYDLPDDVDLSKYKYVLIWCRAFSVLFGYAELPAEEI